MDREPHVRHRRGGRGPYLSNANPIRKRRTEEKLKFLSHHPSVEAAARVGEIFGQDPVALLQDGGDDFLMLVRIAAAQVVERDRKAKAEAEARAAKRGR